MNVHELLHACTAINPLDGTPVQNIYLTVPKKGLPKGGRIRLGHAGTPYGRLCNVKPGGKAGAGYSCVAVFKTAEILAYVKRVYDLAPRERTNA
jgi:hypothetical protein